MAEHAGGETRNIIRGGTQQVVLQGRDFNNVDVTVQAAPAPVALAQLPGLVAGFTGRGQELAALTGLLDPGGTAGPVVVSAVAGLAGVGKTALAVQAAHAAQEHGWFPGGVLFLDLHGYDEGQVAPGQALDALLRALGVAAEHIPPSAEERAGLYRSLLAQIGEPVLVIADNASSEAQVRLLLPGPGPHRMVVTSRHTLAGLGARLLDVAVLGQDQAVGLLDAAVRAARPEDERISADRVAAERLASVCGGLPLALQIAAALLAADPARTAGDLADDLSDELERLTALRYDDGSGTSAPSVAAAFELSYRQLDPAAARVFRLLPVNPGPDVSTAAAAVMADLPVKQVRGMVGRLAAAHLAEAAPGAAGRWRMHDLLRLYALQLSDAHAETDGREAARDRLLGYYLTMADSADDHLRARSGMTAPAEFTGRDDALDWLDAERPSLVAAVAMAADTGRDQTAMVLPLMLTVYFQWRRRFDDWLNIVTISRDAAQRLGDTSYEARALTSLGNVLREVRRFDEAITACQDAAAIYRETGDRHGEGDALNNLGGVLHQVRRFDEAITAYQGALTSYGETNDLHSAGTTLSNLGNTLREVRQFDAAIAVHQLAATIFRGTGDRHQESITLINLGNALQQMRRFDEAITAYQNAAAIFRETGDRHREGIVLSNLGNALREVRRFDEAITTCQDAAAIYKETGDRRSEGDALNNLGNALREVRRFDEAITAYLDAAAIYKETGDRHGEGDALSNLGNALREVRRFDEAITTCQDAAAIFRETGDRQGEGDALSNLGNALREVRRFDEAITAHQEAAAIYKETGDRIGGGNALNNLERDQSERQA